MASLNTSTKVAVSEALKTLEEARSLQDPKLRQADKLIGDIYFSRGSQFAQAYEAYSRVLETNPTVPCRFGWSSRWFI